MASNKYFLTALAFCYRHMCKPVFFLTKPDDIHHTISSLGEFLGTIPVIRQLFRYFFTDTHPSLCQKISGITFPTPVGLAAGFDYEARLTQFLPCLGFGFGTVGTITNLPFEGNPPPRLGRLPKSKSLLVNKGFKNLGIQHLINKLSSKKFDYPLGVSLGKTNLAQINTLDAAVVDIVASFTTLLHSPLKPDYLELNISCPNLSAHIDFYHPDRLTLLLDALAKLKIQTPVFVKMPISKTNQEILDLLSVLVNYSFVTGVIIGNLQTDRQHPTLDQLEVAKFPKGNFSGKPTFDRSNELISLAYKNFKNRLVIIGCGGVFDAHHAYTKIKHGATLVQMITGLIFNGPQVIEQINIGLEELLKSDGHTHISQAVGKSVS